MKSTHVSMLFLRAFNNTEPDKCHWLKKKKTNGVSLRLTGLLHKNDCGGEITCSLQWDGGIFSSSFCSQFQYGPYIMLLSGPAWQWSRVIFSSLVHKVNSISFPPLCSFSTSLLIYSAGCTPSRQTVSFSDSSLETLQRQTNSCLQALKPLFGDSSLWGW